MSRARDLSNFVNPAAISVDGSFNVGINSVTPDVKLDVVGVVSATSFTGDGANISNVSASSATEAGGLTGTPDIDIRNITGTAGTFSGPVNIDDTTESISTSTGALIVDGGVGIAKSLHVGGNVSIAGTVTYEDVTNVDSIGIITARSGVHFGATGAGTLVEGNATGIGIGTDNPGVDLAIRNTGFAGLDIQSDRTSGTIGGIRWLNSTGDNRANIYGLVDEQIILETGGDERVRIGSAGSFAIGTQAINENFAVGGAPGGGTGALNVYTQNSGNWAAQIRMDSNNGNGLFLRGGGSNSNHFPLYVSNANEANSILVVTGNERVGVGLTDPADKLHILGSNSGGFRFTNSDNSDAITIFMRGGNGIANTTDEAVLSLGQRTDVSLITTGRVGIRTTSPVAGLHLGDDAANEGIQLGSGADFTIKREAGTAGVVFNIGNDLNNYQFDVGNSEKIRIDSSGRLLVGTTSASSTATTLLLQGSADGSTGPSYLRLASGTATPGSTSTISQISFTDSGHSTAASIIAFRDGGTWTSGSSQPTKLVFSTTADSSDSATERMRIDSSGTLNTWAALNGMFAHTVGGSSSSFIFFRGYHSATAGSSGSGTFSFQVNTNGNVANTNNSYTALSDLKLKENIADANSQWDDLKALRVRNYNFKEETGHQTFTQLGVIAQEVELVSAGLVSDMPDTDSDGNDLGTVTKTVNYSVLYMKAVKALQEAMARIETLEAKVTALEAE